MDLNHVFKLMFTFLYLTLVLTTQVNPLQLLLLFFGKIETERPSDELMYLLGRAAGLPINEASYTVPAWIHLTSYLVFALSGLGISLGLSYSLGDSTWALSTGIGSLLAAGMYEIGRPERMSTKEAVTLEAQYVEFVTFADDRLQVRG